MGTASEQHVVTHFIAALDVSSCSKYCRKVPQLLIQGNKENGMSSNSDMEEEEEEKDRKHTDRDRDRGKDLVEWR